MISSITISERTSFRGIPTEIKGLKKINYFFGSNGTGKTTISRAIHSNDRDDITWESSSMDCYVYNKDFIDENFKERLKGVFTLGKNQSDTEDSIKKARDDLSANDTLHQQYLKSLNGEKDSEDKGKNGELVNLEKEYKDKFWAIKSEYDEKFSPAFEGLNRSKEAFLNRVILESTNNISHLEKFEDLEAKANSIFVDTPSKEDELPILKHENLDNHSENTILSKPIVGKEDIDIAKMMRRLNNADWVKQGKDYLDTNSKVCPFCQQNVTDKFIQDLEEYFDEEYLNDIESVKTLESDYLKDTQAYLDAFKSILETKNKFVDVSELTRLYGIVSLIFKNNIAVISKKKSSPSNILEVESHKVAFDAIDDLIKKANAKTKEHNDSLLDIGKSKKELISKVWKYIIESSIKTEISLYKTKKESLSRAIEDINAKIKIVEEEILKIKRTISSLEKSRTSVKATIDEINKILSEFGFFGFALAEAENNQYKIIRPDGTEAHRTLSEGEKTFITFLYFYHLIKGSVAEIGVNTDRVVVFDDPVSSLDSDILFIIGSLIRGLKREVRQNNTHIKQIFILTHNVYFHKLVSNEGNPNRKLNDITYWLVKKRDVSSVECCSENPIKTSYHLLWNEIKLAQENPFKASLTICNAMRRIIESYFIAFNKEIATF